MANQKILPFRVSQLAKEMVLAKLSDIADPYQATAEIVRATISVALQSDACIDPSLHVTREVCYGATVGLLMAERDLARGALNILRVVDELVRRHRLDRTEALSAALSGFLDARKVLTPEQFEGIRARVVEAYPECESEFFFLLSRSQLERLSAALR